MLTSRGNNAAAKTKTEGKIMEMTNKDVVIAAARIKSIYSEKHCLTLVREIAKKFGFASMDEAINYVVDTALNKDYEKMGKLRNPEFVTEFADNKKVMAVYTYLQNYLNAISDGTKIDYSKIK